ncbi:hypothetical protein [Aurantivibrio plasticivorans]
MAIEPVSLITALENRLKAAINLTAMSDDGWLLSLKLMYDGEPAGELSFNLHGYSEDEALQIAKDVKNNHFLMREIDEYLWGESD